MEIEKYGIILNVEKYDECVSFYKNLFGLPVLHTKEDGDFRLTSLGLGDAYLLIETGGVTCESEKPISQNPTKLRFNVGDLSSALEKVKEYFSDACINEHDWGSTINIRDPDGNRVGIRDISSTNS